MQCSSVIWYCIFVHLMCHQIWQGEFCGLDMLIFFTTTPCSHGDIVMLHIYMRRTHNSSCYFHILLDSRSAKCKNKMGSYRLCIATCYEGPLESFIDIKPYSVNQSILSSKHRASQVLSDDGESHNYWLYYRSHMITANCELGTPHVILPFSATIIAQNGKVRWGVPGSTN